MDSWSKQGIDPPGFFLKEVTKGKDVITKKFISKGEFVLNHLGNKMSLTSKKLKLIDYAKRRLQPRFLDLDIDGKKMSIDSTLSGLLGCRIREVPEGWTVERRIDNGQVKYWSVKDIYPGDIISCRQQKKLPTFLKVEDGTRAPMLKIMQTFPDPEIFPSKVYSEDVPQKKTKRGGPGYCEVCKENYAVLQEHLKTDSHAGNFSKLSPTIEIKNKKKPKTYVKPKRPCLFCLSEQVQLRRHLRTVHKHEAIIKATEKLTPKAKTREYDRLRKKAIFAVNQKLILEDKPLYRERSQASCNLVICSMCQGFYESKFMSRHVKICTMKEENLPCVPNKRLSELKTLTQAKLQNKEPSRFDSEIISTFKDDEIGKMCKSDKMMKIYGNKEWNTSGKTNRNSVMSNMRALASLLHQFRIEAKDDSLTGEDMLDRTKFKYVELSVRSLTENNKEEKSALKLKLGYALKGAAQAMAGFYSMDTDVTQGEKMTGEIELFIFVLKHNWGSIFQSAQKQLALKRCTVLRKPNQLPLEEDMTKLKNQIEEDVAALFGDPFMVWGQSEFTKLRSRALTRLTLYNARRGGEPARLLLTELESARSRDWIDNSIIQEVNDPIEKALAGKHLLAHQAGKGGRRLVPILIPKDIMPALDKLVDIREQCGVRKDNPYVFPYTKDSMDHCRGWDAVHEVCTVSALHEPNKITATTVRHRASTYYALLDVNPTERKWFLNHMGHTEEVSSNIYTHPPSYMEMCKVGKFFDALDKGHIKPTGQQATSSPSAKKPCHGEDEDKANTSTAVDEIPASPIGTSGKEQYNLRKTVDEIPASPIGTSGKKQCNLRKTVSKVMWKPTEVVAVLNFFHRNLITETVPSKQQVDDFFKAHKEIEKACNGNWRRIKYKVYNEILRRKAKK